MNPETIRIKDIAERANVSVGTVDRVLHDRGRVAPEVRQRVMQIVDELQYEPNLIARTLGTNRLYRLAALIPHAEADPYWAQSKRGIEKAEQELKRYGVRLEYFFFNQHAGSSFIEQTQRITDSKPDGILAAPLFYRESLAAFANWQDLGIPYALFNTQIPEHQPLSYIGQDSYQSGYLAGKLLHYGQTEPATFLVLHIAEDFANSPHLIRKEQGFRDYFEHKGLATSFRILHADMDEPTLDRQLDALLAAHPQTKGILVTTSKAYRIAPYLQYNPSPIRLVGYDLLTENILFLQQGIIDFLINQNPEGQGYQGITALSDFIIFKKQPAALKYLPLDIITQENLQYYLDAE